MAANGTVDRAQISPLEHGPMKEIINNSSKTVFECQGEDCGLGDRCDHRDVLWE